MLIIIRHSSVITTESDIIIWIEPSVVSSEKLIWHLKSCTVIKFLECRSWLEWLKFASPFQCIFSKFEPLHVAHMFTSDSTFYEKRIAGYTQIRLFTIFTLEFHLASCAGAPRYYIARLLGTRRSLTRSHPWLSVAFVRQQRHLYDFKYLTSGEWAIYRWGSDTFYYAWE